MKKNSEVKRIAPRFHAAHFCLDSEDPAELERIVTEMIADQQPVSMAEVLTIQRLAVMQWKTMRAARMETGLVQAMANSRFQHDADINRAGQAMELPDPDSPECTLLLGRALESNFHDSRSYFHTSSVTATTDREYHRCLGVLDRARDLRVHGRYVSGDRKSAASEPAPATAPAVFTAA